MTIISIMLLIIGLTLMAHGIIELIFYDSCKKDKKPRNNMRFYVVRNRENSFGEEPSLFLFLGKPERILSDGCWRERWHKPNLFMGTEESFRRWGLNKRDFKNLKWEDEPVEVFLNLED